jgi:hypothetical protein
MKRLFVIFSCLIILGCNIPTNISNMSNNSNGYTEVEQPKTTPEVPEVEQPKTYTVTFMNGNSVYETQIVEAGEKVIWPINNPSYSEDYKFVSWYPESKIITSDKVFKAIYAYNLYEISEGTFIENPWVGGGNDFFVSYSSLIEAINYYDENGWDIGYDYIYLSNPLADYITDHVDFIIKIF